MKNTCVLAKLPNWQNSHLGMLGNPVQVPLAALCKFLNW